ncbi:MAG: hypothetical protein HRT89_12830 [Lentisphaeria bacterium]|nr:hypothetical protein [Lentisphaeria bacterium]NQZ68943.1 hypothetical protein [Lentisphaeria bacterium]
MDDKSPLESYNKSFDNSNKSPFFYVIVIFTVLVVGGFVATLALYKPAEVVSKPKMTLEQKMTALETGSAMLPKPTPLVVPVWMMAMIFGFITIQILPLVIASHKSRAKTLSRRDLKQITFLAETPMYLGLLGSLIGVCLTQITSGSLAAPMAYLSTIAGIILYLAGRFLILVPLPTDIEPA